MSNNSKTVQDRAIFTITDEQKVVCGLLKPGLEVTQGHSNLCHSKAWVQFPIRLL